MCVRKVHESAQFSEITFQWKIYSGGIVLFCCDLQASLSFFLVIFFFCFLSSFRWYFPFLFPEVALFISCFGRRADSYSDMQCNAISRSLVNNRTPNRSKAITIREPDAILRSKYFFQFNWCKPSSRRGDGFPIPPCSVYRCVPSCCPAAVLLGRSSRVLLSLVKRSCIQ